MLDIVGRRDWGAQPPAGDIEQLAHPAEYVIYTHNLPIPVCHTDEECKERVRSLQKQHIEEGASDIHYNFMIGGNGKAYEGRGWWKQPDKSLKFSEHHGKRVDIAFLGDYGTWDKLPLTLQCSAHRLVQAGSDFFYLAQTPCEIEGDPKEPCYCDESELKNIPVH